MRFQAPAIALQVKHGRSPQAAQSIPTYGACLIPFSCIALPPLALVIARDPEIILRRTSRGKERCRSGSAAIGGRGQWGDHSSAAGKSNRCSWARGSRSGQMGRKVNDGYRACCAENLRRAARIRAWTFSRSRQPFSRRMSLPGRFGSARTRLQSSNDCAGSTFGLTRKVSAEPCTAQARSRPLRQRGA